MEFPELNKIINAMRHIRLSDRERYVMREELKLYMADHPARLPRHRRLISSVRSALAFGGGAQPFVARPMAAAFILVLCVGVGTSYAAENSLPGDPLYPVKVSFNEPLQGALAITNVQKASWNADLASRRLEEAETLAAKGELTPATSALLSAKLQATAQDFTHNVSDIPHGDASAPAIADAQSNFEATLTAHAQVLADIATEVPASRAALAPLLASTESEAANARKARESTELALAADTSDHVRTAALVKKSDAESKVKSAGLAVAVADASPAKAPAAQPTATAAIRTMAATAPSTPLPASATTNASTSSDPEHVIRQGDSDLSSGQYGKAFASFQAVVRAADVTQLRNAITERIRFELHRDRDNAATSSAATTSNTTNSDTDAALPLED